MFRNACISTPYSRILLCTLLLILLSHIHCESTLTSIITGSPTGAIINGEGGSLSGTSANIYENPMVWIDISAQVTNGTFDGVITMVEFSVTFTDNHNNTFPVWSTPLTLAQDQTITIHRSFSDCPVIYNPDLNQTLNLGNKVGFWNSDLAVINPGEYPDVTMEVKYTLGWAVTTLERNSTLYKTQIWSPVMYYQILPPLEADGALVDVVLAISSDDIVDKWLEYVVFTNNGCSEFDVDMNLIKNSSAQLYSTFASSNVSTLANVTLSGLNVDDQWNFAVKLAETHKPIYVSWTYTLAKKETPHKELSKTGMYIGIAGSVIVAVLVLLGFGLALRYYYQHRKNYTTV